MNRSLACPVGKALIYFTRSFLAQIREGRNLAFLLGKEPGVHIRLVLGGDEPITLNTPPSARTSRHTSLPSSCLSLLFTHRH